MAEIRINTTGGLKLYDADNSHYAQIVAGTITSNVDAITLGHDTVTIADNLSLGSDSAIIKFGADNEIALTHVADTGLKLTDSGGTPTLQLHDANESIASDGSKVIITSGGTAFSLPTSDGSNGQVLSTNGSGVLSFADAGGGKVLQVVSTYSTTKSSTTTADTPVYWINASITPASSSNKVLVLGMLSVVQNSDNNRTGGILKRGSTVFKNSGSDHDDFFNGSFNGDYAGNNVCWTIPFTYLDSPSTTSSTTYYLGTQQNAGTTYFNKGSGETTGFTSTITLLEIGA